MWTITDENFVKEKVKLGKVSFQKCKVTIGSWYRIDPLRDQVICQDTSSQQNSGKWQNTKDWQICQHTSESKMFQQVKMDPKL